MRFELLIDFFQMDLKMHWKNPGGWWYAEFSVEDQNLLTIYMLFTFAYLIFTPTVLVCVYTFFIQRGREIDYVS
jgi:hypothetical protein